MEEVDVMVATIAFGMGIDKPDIRYVLTMIFLKAWKVITRKQGGRDVTGEKASALPIIAMRMYRSWRNF